MSSPVSFGSLSDVAHAALNGSGYQVQGMVDAEPMHEDWNRLGESFAGGFHATVHFIRLYRFLAQSDRNRMLMDAQALQVLRAHRAAVLTHAGFDAGCAFALTPKLGGRSANDDLRLEQFELYLQAGLIDINRRCPGLFGPDTNASLLEVCARTGNATMFRAFIDRGADVAAALGSEHESLVALAATASPDVREAMVSVATEVVMRERIALEREAVPSAAPRRRQPGI